MKKIYHTTVKEIGANVQDFQEEGIFITFGEHAPDTLKEYCYMIDVEKLLAEIEVGNVLYINDIEYKITAVGEVVQKNLENLGHLTFSFTGDIEAELAGTLYLEKAEIPLLQIGDTISIMQL